MVTRKPIEKLTDRLLLLYLIDDASKVGRVEGITKIQKLTFLSEWSMLDNREKGFNYVFIKLIHGPYSQELQGEDLPQLIISGFLRDSTLLPTEKGNAILRDFQDLFERNGTFVQRIKETNRKFAKIPLFRLLPAVYRMPHPYIPKRTIEDVRIKTPLLYRIDEQKAREVFRITPEEIATLEIYFDRQAFESLIEASRDKAPTLKYEQVF